MNKKKIDFMYQDLKNQIMKVCSNIILNTLFLYLYFEKKNENS